MGGRGASSGFSDKGNKYGSQYRSLLTRSNIKLVTKRSRQSEPLMETMTEGRVYVVAGGDEIKEITYFDKDNKRVKTIHLNHPHKGMQPHVHHGYEHSEHDGPKGASRLTPKEKAMVDKALEFWNKYLESRK